MPWVRRGISNHITAEAGLRAQVDVQLTLNETEVLEKQPVQLVGPGDITGINSNVIVRTEPRNWITNFEPNYLSFIEFYDEDFPWRYTPAGASGKKLQPWLYLLLLKETEFSRDTNIPSGQPLPSITVHATRNLVFPDPEQTWAWAHVHVNTTVEAGEHIPDMESFNNELDADPDIAIARLFCPRRLEENTAYYAFLIPAFETGRKAGLGLDTDETDSITGASWSLEDTGDKQYPYYYQWFFRTGVNGDFEYLARQLEARVLSENIGVRDMDAHEPGYGVNNLSDNAIVGLEGALKAPGTASKYLTGDDKTAFTEEISSLINQQDALLSEGASDKMIVSPPFYGQWHALVTRITNDGTGDDQWINELNKDPRNRAAAGLGTKVVQKGQDQYLKTAWQQVGEINAANRQLRLAQLAVNTGRSMIEKHMAHLADDHFLSITSPVFSKVLGSPTTLYQQLSESRIPSATLSGAFRRMIRSNGGIAKRLQLPRSSGNRKGLLAQLNDGSVTAAAPKPVPSNIINSDSLAEKITDNTAAGKIASWLYSNPWWFLLIAMVLLLLLFLFTGSWTAVGGVAVAIGTAYAYAVKKARETAQEQAVIATVVSGGLTTETVTVIVPSGTFTVTEPGTGSSTTPDAATVTRQTRLFTEALFNFAALLEFPVAQPAAKPAFDLSNARYKLSAAITPATALAKRILPTITIGGVTPATLDPAMAYPDIKDPMYKPLSAISSEYLVPNLNLVPNNTVSILETNQPFIEAYMAGLNHEFARELLWQEYPTDQRGTCFRQFWDTARSINTTGLTEEEFAEKLKDITPMDQWRRTSGLGEHSNKSNSAGSEDPRVVLVVRGELLKKYPNTVIYAQRAKWDKDQGKLILDDSGGGGLDDGNLLYPIFSAGIDPDISFIGFDMITSEAKGLVDTVDDPATLAVTDLGWFFVLQEVPGEPRFGLDEASGGTTPTARDWDDLSWGNLAAATTCIDVSAAITASVGDSEAVWGDNSADMAYILYQKPVMIAIHANDMIGTL